MKNYIFEKLICEQHDKGPYYLIQYFDLEDRQHHLGYASYELTVISEYLKEYFMDNTPLPAIEHLQDFLNDWCMDAVETEKQGQLVFNCSNCEFEQDGACTIKIFANAKTGKSISCVSK